MQLMATELHTMYSHHYKGGIDLKLALAIPITGLQDLRRQEYTLQEIQNIPHCGSVRCICRKYVIKRL